MILPSLRTNFSDAAEDQVVLPVRVSTVDILPMKVLKFSLL
jgi:hypothetical protein